MMHFLAICFFLQLFKGLQYLRKVIDVGYIILKMDDARFQPVNDLVVGFALFHLGGETAEIAAANYTAPQPS